MVFTSSDYVPDSVNIVLSDPHVFDSFTVAQFLVKLANELDKATSGPHPDPIDVNNGSNDVLIDTGGSDFESGNYEEEPFDDYWDDEPYGLHLASPKASLQPSGHGEAMGNPVSEELSIQIRHDLLRARQAGFRVGHYGHLLDQSLDCYVILSIRVSKLGVPDDVLQAWHLNAQEYVSLLISYKGGYRTLKQLTERNHRQELKMCLRKHDKYKPSYSSVLEAFGKTQTNDRMEKDMDTTHLHVTRDQSMNSQGSDTRSLFIGRPLDELLNGRLITLLQWRLETGLSWTGVEDLYNDRMALQIDSEIGSIDSKYWTSETARSTVDLPQVVKDDHLKSLKDQESPSFPLLAMQFALRHIVHCTEFCLVCHRKLNAEFEALKPYVCSEPLCLYQYSNMSGFGPSIEHEIIAQPLVVDLLVSFCYASAAAGQLMEFPTGMGLKVPDPNVFSGGISKFTRQMSFRNRQVNNDTVETNQNAPQEKNVGDDCVTPEKYFAKFDERDSELIFSKDSEKSLAVNDWIHLSLPGGEIQHRRVIENWHPRVRLGPPIITDVKAKSKSKAASSTVTQPLVINDGQSHLCDAVFTIYDQQFDCLTDDEKRASLCMLLRTLPSVADITDFLQSTASRMSLHNWVDRFSPTALGMLRWIIASNRSCLVLTDHDDRVSGMASYMQFRFVTGNPDKENRFITSVRQINERLAPQHETIFAWHGSPLHNWHSIVREGLHFKQTAHGRSYGDGVYHALDAKTSATFASLAGVLTCLTTPSAFWPLSQLQISQALCLCEIVNCPSEFVSRTPYLVVSQLDWIQTRYLFVKCEKQGGSVSENMPLQPLDQDPVYRPIGMNQERIVMPVSAISQSRRPLVAGVQKGNKRIKAEYMESRAGGYISDMTDTDDEKILYPEGRGVGDIGESSSEVAKTPGNEFGARIAEFVRGSLDYQTLPRLAPPSYATSQATIALQRELGAALKLQDSQPLENLGWYMDAESISTVYQWIVELHSFSEELPLTKDMKAKELTSIVLEMRFGKSYPYSPPFVRVIRPRFLPFQQGGGGHVTMGGALCMELLTNTGWNCASSIEAVLLQVRLAISSTEPAARLLGGPVQDYGIREAIEAFRRACIIHGVGSFARSALSSRLTVFQWEIPADIHTYGSMPET